MKGLFEGGQCNTTAVGATSNQYKRMMGAVGMGAQNGERVMQYNPQGQSFEGQIQQRQAMFKQMNQQWGSSKNQMQAMEQQMQNMMNIGYQAGHEQYERQIKHMQEMQWHQAQHNMAMREQMMGQQYEQAKMMQQAQKWMNELKMEEGFNQAEVSKKDEQASIQNSTDQMLDVMLNDSDPRFQNSQFLGFLKRIRNKEVIIEGKQIREVSLNEAMMENAWNEGEKMQQKNQMTMKERMKMAEERSAEESIKNNLTLQEHWAKKLQDYEKQYQDHDGFEKMLEEKYMEVLKQMNLDMNEAWKSAADLEQELVHGDIRQNYTYSKQNPYLEAQNKKVLALQLINKGLNNEAILALQAYTQEQPEDSEGWRILGRILQENDQDQKSITCFMNSIKHNPQNLDALLSLGVSCTNILDEVKAMNFLKKWIILNPKYKHLNVDPAIIPDHETDLYSYKIEDIKFINDRMIGVFENALVSTPNDPDLFNSLAILYFIKRDYDRAIDLFQRGLQLDPTNYLLMNKVGAAMAHLGRADEAIKLYHMALNVRPNYVRVWVNLGIAHGFKGEYEEAARFYLNALSFRPDAKHVWSYLHTTFMNMQRYDLIALISKQDPRLFTDFDIITIGDLPQAEIDYKSTTEKHILNKESEEWLKEFRKDSV